MRKIFLYTLLYFMVIVMVIPSNPWPRLNQVPNINQGGCGWVALSLAKKLPGSEVWVMSNWRHVVVKWKGRWVDSRGIWTVFPTFRNKRQVSLQELRDRLNKPHLWNPKFDLKDTLIIQQIINSIWQPTD